MKMAKLAATAIHVIIDNKGLKLRASMTPPIMSAKITQLITYPIKSCAGIQHQEIAVNELGLVGDRQWMLVDENGLFLSQRKHPRMALIQPQIAGKTMTISAPEMDDLVIDTSKFQKAIEITVWRDTFKAQMLNSEANQWISYYLGFQVRLVQYTDVSKRLIDQNFANANQQVAFADGYPILVTHEASLAQLNEQLNQAVNMSRFRPNIVLSSARPAWDELNWNQLSGESLQLDLVKPCTRCVMTGVEQTSGQQTGTEVLKTLRQQFPHENKAVFGINAIPRINPDDKSLLKLGAKLEIDQEPN
jgi:uncharacterized protein YcbX